MMVSSQFPICWSFAYISSCNKIMFSSVSAASICSMACSSCIFCRLFGKLFYQCKFRMFVGLYSNFNFTMSVAKISHEDIYFGSDRNSLKSALIFPINTTLIIMFLNFNMFYRSDSPQVKLNLLSSISVF